MEWINIGKRLQITNTHGWTMEQLQKQEKTMTKASIAKRVTVIRLLIQGYYAIQVAELLNIHRETISEYVKKFNAGGLEALISRGYAPGRIPYLTDKEEQEVCWMMVSSTPNKEGDGCETSWDTRILQEVIEEKFSVSMTRSGIARM